MLYVFWIQHKALWEILVLFPLNMEKLMHREVEYKPIEGYQHRRFKNLGKIEMQFGKLFSVYITNTGLVLIRLKSWKWKEERKREKERKEGIRNGHINYMKIWQMWNSVFKLKHLETVVTNYIPNTVWHLSKLFIYTFISVTWPGAFGRQSLCLAISIKACGTL